MLFDPKWEALVKADPLALPSLIAWLEKFPADAEYDYTDSTHCMLCQYFDAVGVGYQSVSPRTWSDRHWREHSIPDWLYTILQPRTPMGIGTFGAALARARAVALD